jgi:hypothetical protein
MLQDYSFMASVDTNWICPWRSLNRRRLQFFSSLRRDAMGAFGSRIRWDMMIYGYWDKDIHDARLVEWMG